MHVHLRNGAQSIAEYEAQAASAKRQVTALGGMWFGGSNQAQAGQPAQVRAQNDALLALAAKHHKLLPIATVHPYDGKAALDELTRVAALGVKVLEIHPHTQGFDVTDAEEVSLSPSERAMRIGAELVTPRHVALDEASQPFDFRLREPMNEAAVRQKHGRVSGWPRQVAQPSNGAAKVARPSLEHASRLPPTSRVGEVEAQQDRASRAQAVEHLDDSSSHLGIEDVREATPTQDDRRIRSARSQLFAAGHGEILVPQLPDTGPLRQSEPCRAAKTPCRIEAGYLVTGLDQRHHFSPGTATPDQKASGGRRQVALVPDALPREETLRPVGVAPSVQPFRDRRQLIMAQ